MNESRNRGRDHQTSESPGASDSAGRDEPEPSTGRMHQNVPHWSDPVCSCEAEPYWQAIGEEMEHNAGEQKPTSDDSEPC